MATKKTNQVKKAEWKGYHKINLSREQNEDFEANHSQTQVTFAELDILCNNGYKFSLSWDDYNTGVSASLYAQSKKMEWAGYTLTAWAGDAQTATALLLYKHYVVAEEQWEIAKHEREGSDVKWG